MPARYAADLYSVDDFFVLMAIAQNPLLTAVKGFQFKRRFRLHASVDFQTDYLDLPGLQATFLTFSIYEARFKSCEDQKRPSNKSVFLL